MDFIAAPSPNFDERPLNTPIDILLLHYTGMPTGASAVERLCDPEAKVSAHYTVDEDGTIFAHVPEERRAWHAGVSWWAGERNINARSIGIEIVNPGHEFGYRSFPDLQIEAVIELSRDVVQRRKIPAARVLGHSDVAPARKTDPGELFPWGKLALAGVGLWPQTRKSALDVPFETGLRAFGYGLPPDTDVPVPIVVEAFQRHFRPAKIDGRADTECEAILAALLREID
jgi:N-acetylmuramoyl-L-alanine amidase